MGSYFYLQVIVIVVTLSLFTSIFNKKVLNLPPAIGIPIVSAVCAFVLQWSASNLLTNNEYIYINIPKLEETVKHIDFYDFLINGVICFVLTASALKFKVSDLKTHWKPITILATLSLVACALIFGGLVFGFQYLLGSPVPLLVLLLLGAALGATDPIGIKGVLSSVKAPNHLMVKLEGESLFNDAMCIAFFMTIFNIVKGGEFTFISLVETLAYEVAIAAVIGYFAGITGLKLLRITSDDIKSLILVTALLAAGSYLIALYAHASAPIACVIAGLIVGNKWQEFIAQKDVDEVNHFWHTTEDLINSFLFTLIGLELFLIDVDIKLILCGIVVFVILHVSRFIANYSTFFLFKSVRQKSLNGSLTILSWGGVRGGISLALVLAVLNEPALKDYASILLGYAFISVLLSGVVCGLGLPAVMNAFYHNPNEPKHGLAGYYQSLCNKLNFTKEKYIVSVDEHGEEDIIVYDPQHVKGTRTPPEDDDKF